MDKHELIANILSYLNEHINENIKISDLEKEFNYNGIYLMNVFKRETSFSIISYVNMIRIKNSIDMIISDDNKILKVALLNGFNSLEYFSETFKNIVGYSPLVFKKMLLDSKERESIISKIMYLNQLENNTYEYINNTDNKQKVKKHLTKSF